MRKRETFHPAYIVSPILVLAFLFIACVAKAQRADWRSRIDEKVQLADSLSLKSQKVFYLNKYLKDNSSVKETWYYTLQNGKILIFEIKYVSDSIEYSEIYYLDNSRLICMEEYEVPYLSVYTDQVRKGAALFFDHDDLRQYVVTGKDKTDLHWSRAFDSMRQFEKRYDQLKKTIQYEPPHE